MDEVTIEQLLNDLRRNGDHLAARELILAELVSGVDAGLHKRLGPFRAKRANQRPEEALLKLQLLARGLIRNELERLGVLLQSRVQVLDGDLGESRHDLGVHAVEGQALLLAGEDLLVERQIGVVGVWEEISHYNHIEIQ